MVLGKLLLLPTLPVTGDLLIWIIVGQGSTVLAVAAGAGCLDIFSPMYHFSLLSPSLWETARYRLSQRAVNLLWETRLINVRPSKCYGCNQLG